MRTRREAAGHDHVRVTAGIDHRVSLGIPRDRAAGFHRPAIHRDGGQAEKLFRFPREEQRTFQPALLVEQGNVVADEIHRRFVTRLIRSPRNAAGRTGDGVLPAAAERDLRIVVPVETTRPLLAEDAVLADPSDRLRRRREVADQLLPERRQRVGRRGMRLQREIERRIQQSVGDLDRQPVLARLQVQLHRLLVRGTPVGDQVGEHRLPFSQTVIASSLPRYTLTRRADAAVMVRVT